MASTAAGRSVGVARSARVVAVRVLGCDGSGSIATTVAGLDYVAQHAKPPAVAMMSLGVPRGAWSRALSDAVSELIKRNVTCVVAAGNSAQDSCDITPASMPQVRATQSVVKDVGQGLLAMLLCMANTTSIAHACMCFSGAGP